MISTSSLAAALHALATGHLDRAVNVLITQPDLEEAQQRALYAAVTEPETPAAKASALGDALRDAGADQALVNECYRAAFYLSDAWSELSDNPLYARFTANRAGFILDKWVHYFPIYTRHLSAFRGKPVRVLEVGVYRGGGLDLLSHYLGPEAKLVGLDIDEAAVRAVKGRFPVVLGDQADPDVLRAVDEEYGPFDIVVDDGGHTMSQQIVTIETLFPRLRDGGAFLVEDTHTSYWPSFGGGLHEPGSFVEWAKARVDDLHWRHDPAIDRGSIWATDLDGIHCYDSVVVFDKKHRFPPFNEVAGTGSFLWNDRLSEVVGNEMLATRDQALHDLDVAREQLAAMTADETDADRADQVAVAKRNENELRLARAELRHLRERHADLSEQVEEHERTLTKTRNDLLESWEQIRLIRRTASWRITKPLRAARRMFD